MLEIRNLSKRFSDRTVLEPIDLNIAPGEIVFVLGKSGVGKSVLLKMIVGLISSSAGEVWLDGTRTDPTQEEAMAKVRRKCGLVFQLPALFDSLNVEENLTFGKEKKDRSVLLEKLLLVHLDPSILSQYPSQLSFGEQKKVSLLRTLLCEPKYLLFDEPTTGLDPVITRVVNDLIQNCAKKLGAGCLVVSHDLASALRFADRIVLIDQGKFVFQGSSLDFEKCQLPLAQAFRKGTVNLV